MSAKYMLDTNIASYIIKGNVPEVRRKLLRIAMSQIFISSITEGELRYGLACRPQATGLRRIVEEFLLRVAVLPWDSEAARHYGILRADLERMGQPLGNLDTLIAAQALAAGMILVSNDRAFGRIQNLRVEDWTA